MCDRLRGPCSRRRAQTGLQESHQASRGSRGAPSSPGARTDDAGVAEPAAVGNDAGAGRRLRLVGLEEHLSLLIAHGALLVHVQAADLREHTDAVDQGTRLPKKGPQRLRERLSFPFGAPAPGPTRAPRPSSQLNAGGRALDSGVWARLPELPLAGSYLLFASIEQLH